MNKRERIKILEKELADLKAEARGEIWGPTGGTWYITNSGVVSETISTRRSTVLDRFNKLMEYHDELCPDHDPSGDWNNNVANWSVCRVADRPGRWHTTVFRVYDHVTVYFPEGVAIELCRKLNSGEVVL